MLFFAGGSAPGVVVSSGGSEAIATGITVNGLSVANGVTLTVRSGASAGKTKLLSGGTEIVAVGGKISGAVTFAPGATLAIAGTNGIAPTILGFAANDTLDLKSFAFKPTEKLTYVAANGKAQGTLTITDGAFKASVTLFGQYVAAGFHLATDHAGGTAITYPTLAADHHPGLAIGHS